MIDLTGINGAEFVGICIAAIVLVVGIIIIWRAHRWVHRHRVKRESPEHQREMLTQRQKYYEGLPPGQL